MFIAREDGTPLRGDTVLRAVQRLDLTPIPSTLEVYLRADSSFRVAEGDILLGGAAQDRYRVIFVRANPAPMSQDGDEVEALQAIAVLDHFHRLSYCAERAVIKERRSMGEIYRACGATAPVREDVATLRFVNFAGEVPALAIAPLLQEEAVAPVWVQGCLSFKRYADLFKQRPVDRLATDSTQAVQSGFLERQEVPRGYSTDAAGQIVHGNREKARGAIFMPRTPERILRNLTRALVLDKTLPGQFAGHINAGDVIDVAGQLRVVVTAAHCVENGERSNQTTRLWLARLEG